MNGQPKAEDSPLLPSDLAVLQRIQTGNNWLRSVLCTLARRGTRLRQSELARALALIEALQPWPWFKGGQFLFDLMEWEDFMVDGPPPPPLDTVLAADAWRELGGLLNRVRALVDGALDTAAPLPDVSWVLEGDDDLPPLEPGTHLYRDVVLGIVASSPPVSRAAVRDTLENRGSVGRS